MQALHKDSMQEATAREIVADVLLLVPEGPCCSLDFCCRPQQESALPGPLCSDAVVALVLPVCCRPIEEQNAPPVGIVMQQARLQVGPLESRCKQPSRHLIGPCMAKEERYPAHGVQFEIGGLSRAQHVASATSLFSLHPGQQEAAGLT